MHTGVRKTFSSTVELCTVGCCVVIMREGSGRRKGEFACVACWFVFGFFFPEEMEGKARVALVCPYASRAGWC